MSSRGWSQSEVAPAPRRRRSGIPASVLFTAWIALVVPAIPLMRLYPAGGVMLLALALLALEGAVLVFLRERESAGVTGVRSATTRAAPGKNRLDERPASRVSSAAS